MKVLRGNPEQVAAVADSLEFEHKYTSGVIAWAPEDAPSDAQIGKVVDEFEKTSWAGLEPDRYAWSAIEHRRAEGGVHVHVLVARVDLETGKSLNIAAPLDGRRRSTRCGIGRTTRMDGAARTIPERARDVQPGQGPGRVGGRKRPPGADYRLLRPAHRIGVRLGSRHDGLRLAGSEP